MEDSVNESSSSEAAPPAVQQASEPINVFAISDFHGRIENDRAAAGAAVLAGALAELGGDDSLFVSAGDNIGASTFTSMVQNDNPTIDILNRLDLDVSAVGNHEFDKGFADLQARIDGTPEANPGDDGFRVQAQFPYLGANVYDASGAPALEEYHIEEVNGVSVGFIGVVTELVPSLVTPAGITGLTFGDMTEAVTRVADDLTDGEGDEADVIVVLAHDGPASSSIEAATADTDFGDLVRNAPLEVDAIIGGHTHLAYAHQIPVGDGVVRPVLQPGQYGEHLGHLSFTYDEATDTVQWIETDVLPLTAAGQPLYPADPEIAAIVDAAKADADVLGQVPLGEITADFNRARQSNGSENRGGESTLGNFVADVQLWATQELGAQIALMNPGGLRTDLVYEGEGGSETNTDGVVTYEEAALVQPFANTLVTMELTGAQIVQILEEQWQPEGASRPFLKLGVSEGFFYTYDPNAPAGERILSAELNGEPLDPAETYTVTTNSFLASGGDNFHTFADGANVADSGRVDLQAMVDFFAVQSGPVAPDYAQRAIGVSGELPDAIETGQELEIAFSSLAFSTNEPKPTQLVASLDGTELGRFPIDLAIVDTTDEVGRATAVITVPDLSAYDSGDIVTLDVVLLGEGFEQAIALEFEATALPPGHRLEHPGKGNVPEHVKDKWRERQLARQG